VPKATTAAQERVAKVIKQKEVAAKASEVKLKALQKARQLQLQKEQKVKRAAMIAAHEKAVKSTEAEQTKKEIQRKKDAAAVRIHNYEGQEHAAKKASEQVRKSMEKTRKVLARRKKALTEKEEHVASSNSSSIDQILKHLSTPINPTLKHPQSLKGLARQAGFTPWKGSDILGKGQEPEPVVQELNIPHSGHEPEQISS